MGFETSIGIESRAIIEIGHEVELDLWQRVRFGHREELIESEMDLEDTSRRRSGDTVGKRSMWGTPFMRQCFVAMGVYLNMVCYGATLAESFFLHSGAEYSFIESILPYWRGPTLKSDFCVASHSSLNSSPAFGPWHRSRIRSLPVLNLDSALRLVKDLNSSTAQR
ncbi:hypothetical protein EVAR_3727_1 [Eumeta japonica]|uniref:Uncharacterized protein n=1 Tax=Eumeta variegata TaxID=151549 RepID=A0A4C1SRP6_EUMVA|nr:hypothetical protein EVAR_3727_1 [Eumeta japonica]